MVPILVKVSTIKVVFLKKTVQHVMINYKLSFIRKTGPLTRDPVLLQSQILFRGCFVLNMGEIGSYWTTT